MPAIAIADVFNGGKASSETYVHREKGRYEAELKQGILENGILCLITGSSKTGKTTLYQKVLSELDKEPIRVRCSASLKADDFWSYPLENLDFSRLKTIEEGGTLTTSGAGSVSGTLGWGWLASLKGTVGVSVSDAKAEKEVKDAILAKPSPTHLVPLLKKSNAVLVVEDFHYLTEDVQREVFQQWKIFTDNEVSVIVVGTTHHGVDLATANSDLIGRITHVDLGRWLGTDLETIATKGLKLLNVANKSLVVNLISEESAGLPILTQQICAQLFIDKGLTEWDPESSISFTENDAKKAMHKIAKSRYANFEPWYAQLVQGPRKKARKYDTYKIILALFAQDPPTFNFTRHDIDVRLKAVGLTPSELPPAASINSTLSSLKNFQVKRNFELLEWSKKDNTVYILEPSFLFYLRWRQEKNVDSSIFQMLIKMAAGAALHPVDVLLPSPDEVNTGRSVRRGL
jgi:hypothetical protein